MSDIQNIWAFLLATIVLCLTPGQDTIYVLTRSTAQGFRAGLWSALGINTGNATHTLLAAVGLSSLLMASSVAFQVVKFAGVAYLVFLGFQMLLAQDDPKEHSEGPKKKISSWQLYRQGLLTNLLNPKVVVFFLAFLPQFVNANAQSAVIPFLILGSIFVAVGMTWCILLSAVASFFTELFFKNVSGGRLVKRGAGAVFIGLGAGLAVSDAYIL